MSVHGIVISYAVRYNKALIDWIFWGSQFNSSLWYQLLPLSSPQAIVDISGYNKLATILIPVNKCIIFGEGQYNSYVRVCLLGFFFFGGGFVLCLVPNVARNSGICQFPIAISVFSYIYLNIYIHVFFVSLAKFLIKYILKQHFYAF